MEDAGIKLSAAASDIMGVSGRAMLEALISGDRDPAGLADLAKRRLRSKIPELTEALTGRFNEHHAFLGPQPASGAESSHPMVRLGAALLSCGFCRLRGVEANAPGPLTLSPSTLTGHSARVVCAETHTGTQLRDAQRALGRPETVFTTLSGLVTAVRSDGARADSERASSD